MRLGMKIQRQASSYDFGELSARATFLWNYQVKGDGKTGHRIPKGKRSTAVMKWSLARRSTADSKGDIDQKGSSPGD